MPASRSLGDVSGRDRRAEQRAFMRSDNRIMVATKSFGMGIDKADIRLVIHHSPPGDLLSYARKWGGQPATATAAGSYSTTPRGNIRMRRVTPSQIGTSRSSSSRGDTCGRATCAACIAFLRECRRLLEVHEPGTGPRTYALFSFSEVEAYFSALDPGPAPAGLPRPYGGLPTKSGTKSFSLPWKSSSRPSYRPGKPPGSASSKAVRKCSHVCAVPCWWIGTAWRTATPTCCARSCTEKGSAGRSSRPCAARP